MQSLSGNLGHKSMFMLCTALGVAVFAGSLRAEYKTEADVEGNEVSPNISRKKMANLI